jgi:multiple sugar transport system substrate-binding protein
MLNSKGRRRAPLLLAGAVSAVLVLAGCSPSGGGAAQADSKSITVGIEAGSPQGEYFQKAGPEFTKATGIKVKFLAVPHDNMHQKFLTDAVSGTGAYDVLTVDEGWMPEFASKGYLTKLDDAVSAKDKSDFAASALQTGTYDGHLYSLPYLVHNLVTYYRTDLLKKAGIDTPPTTWAEYKADAKKLTDPKAGVYGTVVEGKQDAETYTHLLSMVQQAGGDVADASGKPTFDSNAVKSSLQYMQQVQLSDKSSPAGLNDLTTEQGEFLAGHVAMIQMWPYLYSMAKDPAQSKVAGKFAVAMPPGNPNQVATNFAWSFGVNSSSKNQTSAKKFVTWATSSAMLQKLSQAQDLPTPRKSAAAAIATDTSIDQADRDALGVFTKSVSASSTIPLVTAFPQYTTAMAVALSSVMSQSSSIDDAVTKAQQTMQSAYESSSK